MVPGVPPRTDLGCQAVAEDASEGHDTACKGAVTDALKRALRSFGDQFGNALYGDAAEKALLCPLKETLAHLGKAQGFTEERLRQAVKQKTGKALDALSASEVATLLQALARRSSPKTTSRPAGSPVR
jgi:recombination DNA repair RAD52 pathway protein